MPTQLARQAEREMLRLTFSQQGSTISRDYRRNHSMRRNTRRMLQDVTS